MRPVPDSPPDCRRDTSSVVRRIGRTTFTTFVIGSSVFSSFFVFGAQAFEPGPLEQFPPWLVGISFVAALAAATALRWRHQHPVLVTGIAVIPPLLLVAEALAALIALAALAASRRDRVLWLGVVLVLAGTTLAVRRDARREPDLSVVQALFGADSTGERVDVPLYASVLIAAVLTAIPLGVGLWRRTRRELSRSEVKEQELLSEMARQEERARIAREMHDVLGHRLTQLSLQAGALEVSAPTDDSPATRAARSVRATARESLDDLRQVVGVLREGGSLTASGGGRIAERTQPTLADIPELIAETRRTGVPANVTVVLEESTAAPTALAAGAYRIVQESLTNVARHAGGAGAEVSVLGKPGDGVSIEISNPLPREVSGAPTVAPGTGLTGIAERVDALGGTVSTGPTGEGTFRVHAWLPWERTVGDAS
ncbi:histidine kinase [Haloechinothrix sp. LS1_15]|uniref:sensor histidine kinase n=1 Tax=Haloechinothrix sp. LS1_15 TaxID=2652248 RepID=UPI002945AAC4|nr:histidine kinase [Haloechinothrix sp. LS1_15]MDV6012332.1 two-component sensor histidine kinase [Haloechinothrix sp. LS1_15]